MVQIIGTCKVKSVLSEGSLTVYAAGGPADIAGKTLRVVCRTTRGDLLCLDDRGTALADIDARDVEEFTAEGAGVAIETAPMLDLFAPLRDKTGGA